MDAQKWIKRLGLQKHPEGGFFREVYRSDESVAKASLPSRFPDKRSFSTAIYYLLNQADISTFHRIQQDEIWHFYEGSPVTVYTLASKRMTVFRLGDQPDKGQLPMLVIPRGTIFAAELENKKSYALMGCTVSPGFEFEDFELLERSELAQQFPEHLDIIRRMTHSR